MHIQWWPILVEHFSQEFFFFFFAVVKVTIHIYVTQEHRTWWTGPLEVHLHHVKQILGQIEK